MHFVYVVERDADKQIKIGKTSHLYSRLLTLEKDGLCQLRIVKVYEYEKYRGATLAEKYLHVLFKKFNIKGRQKEWFTPEVLPLLPKSIDPEKAERWLARWHRPYQKRTKRVWSDKQGKYVEIIGFRIGGYGLHQYRYQK